MTWACCSSRAQGVSNRLAAAGAANSTDAGGLSEAFFLQMQFRVALQQQVGLLLF
jgi:hypothetical protein